MKHILGAPLCECDRKEFKNALLKRFSGDNEQAFSYINNVLDRQIAKASGLLTFNSILVATTTLSKNPEQFITLTAGSLALFSCIPLLLLMYVFWGGSDKYSEAQADFEDTCETCYRRSYALTISLIASFLATVFIAISLWQQYP